jgi:hypothetical protein
MAAGLLSLFCPTSGSPLSGGGKATIEVLPTPGPRRRYADLDHPGSIELGRQSFLGARRRALTYAVGLQTGAGIDGYLVTLDIAVPGSVAAVQSGWPLAAKGASTTARKAACLRTSARGWVPLGSSRRWRSVTGPRPLHRLVIVGRWAAVVHPV